MTFLIIWFGAGLLLAPFAYAVNFAYWQRKYPSIAEEQKRQDIGMSFFYALFIVVMPPAILLSLALTGFAEHGLKWR